MPANHRKSDEGGYVHSKAMQGVAAAVALALAVVVAACGSSSKSSSTSASTPSGQPGAGKPAVTIGDKNFTEQFILGQLYAQALRAKGYTVNVKNDIGSSELIDKALTSGQISGYPEYSGIVLTAIAHDNKSYASPQATYDAVKKFENGRGFTVLNMTPFNDVDALAVKPPYAKQHNLAAVPDLKGVGRFTLGAPPEFKTRFTGLVGMKQIYGVTNVNFKPLAIGLQYKALDAGQIQVADVFTTDGQLQRGSYTILKDPKNIFGFQNVVPIFSKKVIDAQGPEFSQILNAVSAKLTVPAMQQMNAAVDLDKNNPAEVAKKFLQANNLL
jgi:osmoprotectant transport system substrate-binding protein